MNLPASFLSIFLLVCLLAAAVVTLIWLMDRHRAERAIWTRKRLGTYLDVPAKTRREWKP